MVDGSDPEKHAVPAVSNLAHDAIAEGNEDTTSSASETEDETPKDGGTPIITRKPIPTAPPLRATLPAVRQPLPLQKAQLGAGLQKPQLPPVRSAVDLPGASDATA